MDAQHEDAPRHLLGGGEDSAQLTAVELLRAAAGLAATLRDRAVTLAVCAGLQVLGSEVVDSDGRRHPGLDVLDVATRPGRRRSVGEAVALSDLSGVGSLTGFHNHRGITTLGDAAVPLATTVSGRGNGAGGRSEGARTPRGTGPGILATSLHGPVLARNPALADHVLGRALDGRLLPLDPGRVPEPPALREQCLGYGAARSHETYTDAG